MSVETGSEKHDQDLVDPSSQSETGANHFTLSVSNPGTHSVSTSACSNAAESITTEKTDTVGRPARRTRCRAGCVVHDHLQVLRVRYIGGKSGSPLVIDAHWMTAFGPRCGPSGDRYRSLTACLRPHPQSSSSRIRTDGCSHPSDSTRLARCRSPNRMTRNAPKRLNTRSRTVSFLL